VSGPRHYYGLGTNETFKGWGGQRKKIEAGGAQGAAFRRHITCTMDCGAGTHWKDGVLAGAQRTLARRRRQGEGRAVRAEGSLLSGFGPRLGS
jgi:hypothetical protein